MPKPNPTEINFFVYKLRNSHCFVFPKGINREFILDTLEAYCKAKKFSRARTYEAIGSVLNDNCFQEKWIESTQQFINVAIDAIEVEF